MNVKQAGKNQRMRAVLVNMSIYLHFCVFTKKPYSEPLDLKVVYIPLITLSQAMSYNLK